MNTNGLSIQSISIRSGRKQRNFLPSGSRTKPISIAIASGTRRRSTIGVSRRSLWGSSSTYKSDLVSSLPQRPSNAGAHLLLFLGAGGLLFALLVGSADKNATGFAAVIAIVALLLLFGGIGARKRPEELATAQSSWDMRWMCSRCGNQWEAYLVGNREYLFDQVPALMNILEGVRALDEMGEYTTQSTWFRMLLHVIAAVIVGLTLSPIAVFGCTCPVPTQEATTSSELAAWTRADTNKNDFIDAEAIAEAVTLRTRTLLRGRLFILREIEILCQSSNAKRISLSPATEIKGERDSTVSFAQ